MPGRNGFGRSLRAPRSETAGSFTGYCPEAKTGAPRPPPWPCAAAAGVGTLGIVDFDVVDYTNLQRQIIHSTNDVGRKKLDSAAEKLKAINPFLNLRTFETKLTSAKLNDY